jgi:hypothetical protein
MGEESTGTGGQNSNAKLTFEQELFILAHEWPYAYWPSGEETVTDSLINFYQTARKLEEKLSNANCK